ncbi:hypothetical protein [Paenibacillus crassostreae]|nr:hypothetical protein [Paenibacillus crassostreae]
MTFKEAKEKAALPGIDDILEFVDKYFAKSYPPKWLRIEGKVINRKD